MFDKIIKFISISLPVLIFSVIVWFLVGAFGGWLSIFTKPVQYSVVGTGGSEYQDVSKFYSGLGNIYYCDCVALGDQYHKLSVHKDSFKVLAKDLAVDKDQIFFAGYSSFGQPAILFEEQKPFVVAMCPKDPGLVILAADNNVYKLRQSYETGDRLDLLTGRTRKSEENRGCKFFD